MKRFLSRVFQWSTSLLMLVAIWQLFFVPRTSRVFLATPGQVVDELRAWWKDGTLVEASSRTMIDALGGLVIGGAGGMVLAVALYFIPRVGRVLEPFVVGVYAMPKIALAPLLFLWLGRGSVSTIVFVAISTGAILMVSTSGGLSTVDGDQLLALRRMGATRVQTAQKLLVPHTLGFIAAGLAIAGPFALLTALVAEMLQSSDGLGGLIVLEAGQFNARGVLAATVLATVLALVLNAFSLALARRRGTPRVSSVTR